MRIQSLAAALSAASLLWAGAALAEATAPSDCTALWKQADASAAGALTQTQAQPFVTNFASVDTDKDGKISNGEFMKGCSAGHVRKTAASSTTGGSPAAGATGSTTGSTGGSTGTGAGSSSGSGGGQPMPSR